jgi:hypothetical protein
MYATAIRDHDAEWLLHQERVITDRMVAAARRFGPPRKSRSMTTTTSAPEPDPAEQAKALRVVCRLPGTHMPPREEAT